MGHYFRQARMMAFMAEMKRDREKRFEPFTPADFMFEPAPYMTDEERLLEQQKAELAAIGG